MSLIPWIGENTPKHRSLFIGDGSVSTGKLNSLKTMLIHVQISSYIDISYKIQRRTTYRKTKSGNQFLSLERRPKNWSLFGRFDQLFAIKSQTRVQNTFFELIAELRTSRRFDRCIERTGRTYRGENIPSRARFFRGHAKYNAWLSRSTHTFVSDNQCELAIDEENYTHGATETKPSEGFDKISIWLILICRCVIKRPCWFGRTNFGAESNKATS